MRKWPRFHWYETAGNCSNRRPRFEVPPVKRLTVTRGYGLGYPKRRQRGLSLGSPCVGSPGNPVSPSSPLVSCLLSRCGGRASRCIARVASRQIHGFLSLSLSMDPSCFSFTDYCEIFFFAESGKKSHTEMELVKEFQFLDDELVFGHQQTELLSLNSCCVVFLKH